MTIMLPAAAGQANIEIGAVLGCHPVTAGKWRGRVARQRIDGLIVRGAPRRASHDQR